MAAYHVAPRELTYEDYFGLQLNKTRTIYRQSQRVTIGLMAAFGTCSDDYYRAVSSTKQDAENLKARHKAQFNRSTSGGSR